MSDISSIALSGLNDAVRRVSVAANNIARQGTTNGTTNAANSSDASPANASASPTTGQGGIRVQGLIPQDDTDTAANLVNIKQAEIGYKANIAVLKVNQDLQRDLLNDFKV